MYDSRKIFISLTLFHTRIGLLLHYKDRMNQKQYKYEKEKLILFSALALSGAMVSCSSSEDIDLGEAKQVVNMLSEPEPVKLTHEQVIFANNNNHFTLNFLKEVNKADKSGQSFIYSPLSITYVLGMVNDAAAGQTEQELEQTLGFHQGGIQAVNDYCKKLIDGLPKVDNCQCHFPE